jgi:membrane protease YdiL (CAAX protease family)
VSPLDLLRLLGPALLAAAAALGFDTAAERRGWLPPALAREPWRRAAAFAVLTGIFWVGIFLPLGTLGLEAAPETVPASLPQLFLLHALLAASLLLWLLLGYGTDVGSFAAQIGLRVGESSPGGRARAVAAEVGIGVAAGIGAWLAVIAAMVAVAGVVVWGLGEEALPHGPPPVVPWMAALPVGVRLALSLSAGVVEESFFRGFLQPRIGILASTAGFVLAHLSYQQPLMLVGVTLLSLIYAGLVRWRRNIWVAMAAHALFDAVQLLVVIPAALEMLPAGSGP